MKKYTTIHKSIASKLNSIDTYRFTCLSFTPRKGGYTDSTFKQLADICREPEATIKHFTERLKSSEIIKIDEPLKRAFFLSYFSLLFKMM